MKFISKLFKKRADKIDPYAYMGSLGVSPKYMMIYQDAIKKIDEYEKNNQ